MNATFTNLFPQEKFAVLIEIIDVCNKNKIDVVVVNSPVFLTNPAHDQVSEQIRSLCALYPNASSLDYSKYDSVYNREKFFRDYSHMNNDGATLFTRALSKNINDIVKAKSYVKR